MRTGWILIKKYCQVKSSYFLKCKSVKGKLTNKNWLAVVEPEGLVEGLGFGQVGKKQEHQEELHLVY